MDVKNLDFLKKIRFLKFSTIRLNGNRFLLFQQRIKLDTWKIGTV